MHQRRQTALCGFRHVGLYSGPNTSEGYSFQDLLPERQLRLFGVRLFDKYCKKELRTVVLVHKLAAWKLVYLTLPYLRALLASAGSLIEPANTPPPATA